jgi:hypothetical protein
MLSPLAAASDPGTCVFEGTSVCAGSTSYQCYTNEGVQVGFVGAFGYSYCGQVSGIIVEAASVNANWGDSSSAGCFTDVGLFIVFEQLGCPIGAPPPLAWGNLLP